MRALGTTLRYALAGGAIFGGTALVSQLSQIQQQLGLISAISPTAFGGLRLAGDDLTKFGEQAEDAAFRALTPITEFNDGLVNLVSTVQNVPQNEVVPILEQIAQTARLSLTPVDEATKGISGLLVAFGKPTTLANVQRMLAEYQRLIFTVPGGAAAGPQIIQQLPQLASVSRLANLTPEQMFGLLNTTLRAGGTPSTSARGLQYLIQGLAQPPNAKAKAALAGIGVTPEFIQERGGVAGLLRLIQAVKTKGVRGNTGALRAMTPEVLDQLEGITNGQEQLSGLGVSGAGAEFARTAVGRIHGVRTLILLAAQQKQTVEDLRAMTALGEDHAQQVSELRDNWQAFAKRARLREASMSINQMTVDVVQAFEPILNWTAAGLAPLRKLTDRHPNEVAFGGAGLLAALFLGRGRGIGLGGLGRGAGALQAVNAIGTGGKVLGDSPINPMFVTVVNTLFGPGGLSRGGGVIPKSGIPGEDLRTATRGGRMGRLARLGRIGLGIGGLATGADLVYEWNKGREQEIDTAPKANSLLKYLQKAHSVSSGFGLPHAPPQTGAEKDILERLKKGYINEASAERMLRRVATSDQLKQAGVTRVVGKVDVTVREQDRTGKTTKTTTVPVDLFPQFSQPAPQTRGKPKTYRSR